MEKKQFKGKLDDIYPFTLGWIDWGLLRFIMGLSSKDPKKYDMEHAQKELKKVEAILVDQFHYQSPKLLLGYQLLEADKKERVAFLLTLWNKMSYPVILALYKFGHNGCHLVYTLIEIEHYLLNFAQNTQINKDIYLKIRQKAFMENIWQSRMSVKEQHSILNLQKYYIISQKKISIAKRVLVIK